MAVISHKIIRNMAQCHKCLEIIESKTVHDFRTCSCGGLSVDGGKYYLKRCYRTGPGDGYTELSEEEA